MKPNPHSAKPDKAKAALQKAEVALKQAEAKEGKVAAQLRRKKLLEKAALSKPDAEEGMVPSFAFHGLGISVLAVSCTLCRAMYEPKCDVSPVSCSYNCSWGSQHSATLAS